MANELCRACETANWCSSNGCIPLTVEDAATRLHRVMHIPIKREEADAPVSTPEQFFDWIALAWTLTLASVVAVVVTVVLNWPLFLAAVK